jgi:hypothetical protein
LKSNRRFGGTCRLQLRSKRKTWHEITKRNVVQEQRRAKMACPSLGGGTEIHDRMYEGHGTLRWRDPILTCHPLILHKGRWTLSRIKLSQRVPTGLWMGAEGRKLKFNTFSTCVLSRGEQRASEHYVRKATSSFNGIGKGVHVRSRSGDEGHPAVQQVATLLIEPSRLMPCGSKIPPLGINFKCREGPEDRTVDAEANRGEHTSVTLHAQSAATCRISKRRPHFITVIFH